MTKEYPKKIADNVIMHAADPILYVVDNFLNNVSKSLKSGGRFIGTCFDGKKVFEKLDITESELDTYIDSKS